MSRIRRTRSVAAAGALAVAVSACRGNVPARETAAAPDSPPAPAAADPHAGHTPEEHARAMAAQQAADPHAGHRAAPAEPHPGHDSGADSPERHTGHATAADPHASHRAAPSRPHETHAAGHAPQAAAPHADHAPPTAAPDPHAGHAVAPGPHAGHAAAPADPHAGHAAPPSAPPAPAHDHAAMGHRAPAPPAPLPSPEPATAVAAPGAPAVTLQGDALDAPAATSVRDAERAAATAASGHAMSHGTYRQVDAGRDDVPITSPVGAARRGSAPDAGDPHAGHAMPSPSPSPEPRR